MSKEIRDRYINGLTSMITECNKNNCASCNNSIAVAFIKFEAAIIKEQNEMLKEKFKSFLSEGT